MDAVIFLAARRDHQNRNLRELADLSACGKTVQLRHHDVQNDQIKFILTAQFDGRHAVRRFLDLIAFKFRVLAD